MQNIISLIERCRSTRRFDEAARIGVSTMREVARAARMTGSAGNLQPLRYVLINSPKECEKVFSCLGWAAYLKDWKGPEPGERPTGYFVVLADPADKGEPKVDAGIVMQTVMLAACSAGLSGCIFGNVNRKKLASELGLPEELDVLYVIALGVPAERVELESLPNDGDVRYWRDAEGVHHVPKRALTDLVVGEYLTDED